MSDPNFTQIQEVRAKEDDLLAAAAIRDAAASTWLKVSGWVAILDIMLALGCYFLGAATPVGAAFAIIFGPAFIAFGFRAQGYFLKANAQRSFNSMPLWEKHRINKILNRLSDSKEVI